MGIRNIDSAGRLHDRASVPRLLLRSLLWAAIIFFSSAFLSAALLPSENLALSEWPSAIAAPLAFSLAILVATMAILWSRGWLARIAAALCLLLAALWLIEAILFIPHVAEGGPHWLATALVRIVLVAWIAAETAIGCIAMALARPADLEIAGEPVGAASLLGAPPALAYLTRRRWRARALFLIAALAFALAVLQFAALQYSASRSWSNASVTCTRLRGEERASCYSRVGVGDLVGQFAVWPIGFVVAVLLARIFRSRARRLTIRSADEAMAADPRPPILFLRWFGNDQGEIAEANRSPLRWLLGATQSEPTIERMLVEEFSRLGPTIALGNPQDRARRDFGVWRDFPPDEAWQDHIRRMAESASAIVMVVDVTDQAGALSVSEGVTFELSLLAEPALKAKTMFMTGTRSLALEHHARVWEIVADLAALDLSSHLDGTARRLAVFQNADGSLAVACSDRFTRADYAMALHWFFTSRPTPN